MKQTPIHDRFNEAVFQLIPDAAKRIIEIGCSSGALAKEFKKNHPDVHWIGVEIDPDYAELAKKYCDTTIVANLDEVKNDFYVTHSDCDCWIFGDVLEHLKDPWKVVKSIRNVIPHNGCIVASIPNAQNWSLIAKLSVGDFRYEDTGLLDRTHLRWFTRKTVHELFENEDFIISEGLTTISHQPNQEILNLIGKIADKCGVNPMEAMADAIPLQFVVRVSPI